MKKGLNKDEIIYYLKKTWHFTKGQRKVLILYTITSFLLSVIAAIVPIFTAKQLINITDSDFDALIQVSLIIFSIEISRNLFRLFTNKTSQIFFRETLFVLQHELAHQMLKLETKEIDNNSSGVFIDRINKDTQDIADIFSQLNFAITDIIANLGIVIAVFIINKFILIYFILAMIIIFLIKRISTRKYFELDKLYRKLNEKNTGLVTELVRGMRDIKVLNANETFINKMKEKFRASNKERYNMSSVRRKYNFVTGSVQDLFTLLFVFIGMLLVNKDILTISSFVVLYMYQDKVYNLLSYTTKLYEYLKNFNLSAKRVFEIIDNNVFKKEVFGSKHLNKINGDFEFDNVSFSYNEEEIIKNISFKVNANETVAFVGKSGSGKTTLFNLLTKLYSINSGQILIDNINIDELDEYSLRNNISMITQSPYIFNFSIRENLKIVDENISDEKMIEACKTACLDDFIMRLPNGYDTIVGEGGVNLSGGQRQRLAIARALLKGSEIILFDEATSALDNETQLNIQHAINNMRGEYTIMIIAHRLSTVINCNRIILIDDGRVVAQGTHKELLACNDLYKKLYEKELME